MQVTLRLIAVALIGGCLFLAGMITGGSAVKAMMAECVREAQAEAANPVKELTTIPVRNRWGRIVGRYTVVRVTTDGREDVWILRSNNKEGR